MRIAPSPSDKSMLSEYSSAMSARFGRCLAPFTDCQEKPIRAHTVQNSRVLERLQRNNHVIMMGHGLVKGVLEGGLQSVSRNEATTFQGLCAKHDSTLFERIDLGSLDVDDPEVRLLLSWRAITHELHQSIEAAGRIQTAYIKKVDAGELNGDVPTPMGVEATSWMHTAYETFLYRSEYWDVGINNAEAAPVEYQVFKLLGVQPILAASGLFSFQTKARDTARRIALNIWPSEKGETLIIFGYCHDDASRARSFIRKLRDKNGDIHPGKLSAALLQHLGNFVLCPDHVDNWSDEKRSAIELAFHDSLFNSSRIPSTKLNNLFEG